MNTKRIGLLAILVVASAVGFISCGPGNDPAGIVHRDSSKPLKLDELFPRDRLINVEIKLADDDWEKIRRQSRSYYHALQPKRQFEEIESPYTYVEATVTIDGVTFPDVGLRKKGFIGSQSYSRPSLKVKLNYTDDDGGIDGLTTLTFNNNKQDYSLMSQFMGYALFEAAGSTAPRSSLAKVSVNGENLGVYSHVESVKKPLIKREFGNSDGTLYEGTLVDFLENWENSFERKFGKDKPGREHILRVIDALNGGGGEVFFGGDAIGRAWVPTSGEFDNEWFKPDFDDSEWLSGENGAGYERGEGYEKLINESFDFEDQMYGKTTSVYLRFPFEIEDLDKINAAKSVRLRVQCDDGFVAYINGHEVAKLNAPDEINWRSVAGGSGDDGDLMMSTIYDISKHRDKLRTGRNVLAIHGMNNSRDSTDFLIVAELQTSDFDLETEIWNLIDEESFYTFWAMEGLLSFWDGYSGNRNNFFVYLNPDTGKFHFLPWGADCMFEKYSRIGEDRRSPRSVRTIGMIAHKLYQIPGVRKKYAATMKHLLAEHWDEEKLLAETHRIEEMVDPYISSKQRGPFYNRQVDYKSIRRFIRNRRADIESEISGDDMPVWTAVPEPPLVMR